MIKNDFVLANTGNELLNDVVDPILYNLRDRSYEIELKPQSKYWRFGIRISKAENIEFYHPISRYKTPDFWEKYIDIHLGAGEWDNANWSLSNRIQLVQYNLNQSERIIDQQETFVEYGKIKWGFDFFNSRLVVNYTAEGCKGFNTTFEIPEEYKYFKLFAWAEKIDFKLQVSISTEIHEIYQQRNAAIVIGNVVLCHDDLFDKSNIANSDIIVFPCSNNGSTTSKVNGVANLYNIPLPQKSSPGTIKSHEFIVDGKKVLWIWAYSVDSERGSSIEIVEKICNNLVNLVDSQNLNVVNLPLLGTGAGGLDKIEICEVYIKIFNRLRSLVKFKINILGIDDYRNIFNHFNGLNETRVNEFPFRKTTFNFRDKTKIDPVLGVRDLAIEVSDIIQKIPANEYGAMIGIFGKWGRGKSYFIDKIWEELSKNKKISKVDFHAWKYQDTPAIWAYLYEQFANQYYSREICSWDLFWRRIALNYHRLGSGKLLLFIIPFLFSITIAFIIPFAAKWHFFLKLLSSFGFTSVFSGLYIYFKYEKSARSLFKDYYSKITFSKLLGVQAEVQKELESLIKVWSKKSKQEKIILFVDDIDRCSEYKIIEIIDALRVMVEDQYISQKVIVVAAIDDEILQNALRHKYKFLSDNWVKEEWESKLFDLTNQYLDKVFVLGIKLGDLSDEERDEFFIELTKSDREDAKVLPLKNYIFQFKSSNFEKTSSNNISSFSGSDFGKDGSAYEVSKDIEGNNEINKTPQSIPESDGKISNIEFDVLRKCLKTYSRSTPRQIRVFYYRYLLAKSILVLQYKKSEKKNIWLEPRNSYVFVNLLIKYSQFEGRKNLSKHKSEAFMMKNSMMGVHFFNDISFETEDYRELLAVLDIVIAY